MHRLQAFPNIRRYTARNENSENGYPLSNVLFFLLLRIKTRYLLQNVSCVSDVNPITNDVADDVRFPTVYRRIYCRNLLTLSNQTSRYIRGYIRKYIRINHRCSS